jgi:hypothetical protein
MRQGLPREGERRAGRPTAIAPVHHRQADCGRRRPIPIIGGTVGRYPDQYRAADDRHSWRAGRRGARPYPHPRSGGTEPCQARGQHMSRPSHFPQSPAASRGPQAPCRRRDPQGVGTKLQSRRGDNFEIRSVIAQRRVVAVTPDLARFHCFKKTQQSGKLLT